MARVFIGIPVYNGEKYLASALESLLTQSYTDWVALISDNASTDATPQIAEAYCKRDPRLRYYRHAVNLGAAPNFNFCVQRAEGEFFKWMAHDDICRPSYLLRCVERLEADPGTVLCQSRVLRIGSDGEIAGAYTREWNFNDPDPTIRFANAMGLDHACVTVFGVMRLDILKQTPAIAPFVGSDRPLLAELALHGRLEYVPEDLFLWRDHEDRSVKLKNRKQRLTWFDVNARTIFSSLMTRQLLANQRAALRVPRTSKEKARAFLKTLHWSVANRRRLLRDIRAIAGATVRSIIPRKDTP